MQGEEEKQRIRYIVNKLAQQTMRGSLLMHNGSFLSIEELILAPFLSRRPTVSNYFTVELIVLKEMTQALADLFGLMLPVTLKNGWTV